MLALVREDDINMRLMFLFTKLTLAISRVDRVPPKSGTVSFDTFMTIKVIVF